MVEMCIFRLKYASASYLDSDAIHCSILEPEGGQLLFPCARFAIASLHGLTIECPPFSHKFLGYSALLRVHLPFDDPWIFQSKHS